MSRIAYVNGAYLYQESASVHIEDRGYQFSDGAYEVFALRAGKMIDFDAHLERLKHSLSELRIPMPMSHESLIQVLYEIIRRNRSHNGLVYLQVTRGKAPRNHVFSDNLRPILVIIVYPLKQDYVEKVQNEGIHVITVPDERWYRCDIKSISLLPNILARQLAQDVGAQEAWQVDSRGFVTEGAGTNAWIIDQHGVLRTRSPDHAILNGITRQILIKLIKREGIVFQEKAFTPQEAYEAREAFSTASTLTILPVILIDNQTIASGQVGKVTSQLLGVYKKYSSLG